MMLHFKARVMFSSDFSLLAAVIVFFPIWGDLENVHHNVLLHLLYVLSNFKMMFGVVLTLFISSTFLMLHVTAIRPIKKA